MTTEPATSRLLVLLSGLHFLISVQFGSVGKTQLITAEPGDDAVLPCETPEKKPVKIVEWSRPGESDHVALYRSGGPDKEGQHPSYKDRVDLQDREMKDGDVSLVLKNVTTVDAGTYECRVDGIQNKRWKRSHLDTEPISIVFLLVSAPGNKDEQKDRGNEGQKKEGGNTALIASVSVVVLVAVVALFAVVVFWLYNKHRRSPQEQNQPPAAETELQAMNVENHPEPEM